MDPLRGPLSILRAATGSDGIFQFSGGIQAIISDPDDDPEKQADFQYFLRSLLTLREGALAAREQAISYRDFKVGCAVLARNPEAPEEERYYVFLGANMKVTKESRPICAEQVAVQAARCAGYTDIIGIVVVGAPQPQEDPDSGVDFLALDPCVECATTFRHTPGIEEDTYFVTFNTEIDQWKIYLFWEIPTNSYSEFGPSG